MSMTGAEVRAVYLDPRPELFWSYLRIKPRAGGLPIPFTNFVPEQLDMTEKRLQYQENFFLKGRNIGAGLHTQAFDFWYVWRQAWLGVDINTFITSHVDETYEVHIDRVVELNASLPFEMRLETGRVNAHQAQFYVPGTTRISEFRGATAGGKRGQGRGFTFQRYHGTEFAFYEDGDGVLQSVTGAMHEGPHRSVTLETTPNGPDGHAPELFGKWEESETRNADFYPWTMNPTHVRALPRGMTPETFTATLDASERALLNHKEHDYPASLENISWRRNKLENGTEEKFRKEYPFTKEEAFADSGDVFFKNELLRRMALGKAKDPSGWRIYHPYRQGHEYALSVDVSNGSGDDGDDCVIQILDAKANQCAVYSDNTTGPTDLGDMVYETWLAWGQGVVLIEENMLGKTTRERFEQLAGAEVAYREKRAGSPDLQPFNVWGNQNGGNKEDMFAHAKHLLDTNRARVNDRKTARQILGIRKQKNGGYAAPKGQRDDHATSFVYGCWVTKHLRQQSEVRLEEWMARHNTRSRVMRRYGAA